MAPSRHDFKPPNRLCNTNHREVRSKEERLTAIKKVIGIIVLLQLSIQQKITADMQHQHQAPQQQPLANMLPFQQISLPMVSRAGRDPSSKRSTNQKLFAVSVIEMMSLFLHCDCCFPTANSCAADAKTSSSLSPTAVSTVWLL